MRRIGCWLRGGHQWLSLRVGAQEIFVTCRRCLASPRRAR